ncbi:uncharacterized protein VTP21DRAFT_2302 [Calcarisporiella thermophila]|uniref:uncharacterized protein n=1 Tax=Calcarisporiella thermophila TaxID=911321 RepID=UPI0037444356
MKPPRQGAHMLLGIQCIQYAPCILPRNEGHRHPFLVWSMGSAGSKVIRHRVIRGETEELPIRLDYVEYQLDPAHTVPLILEGQFLLRPALPCLVKPSKRIRIKGFPNRPHPFVWPWGRWPTGKEINRCDLRNSRILRIAYARSQVYPRLGLIRKPNHCWKSPPLIGARPLDNIQQYILL